MGCGRMSPARSSSRHFPTRGGAPLTAKVQLKYWPVETNGQPVVVRRARAARPRSIQACLKEIEVFTSKFTWFEIGSEAGEVGTPRTARDRRSQPALYVRADVGRRAAQGCPSFADAKVFDPTLRPLMAMIKVTVDEAIEALLPDMALRVVRHNQ